VATGVDQLADELVLSCEVRSAKPAPEIFRHALGRLGVGPEAAVFVDDQARFCAGSVAVGIRAAQIVRGDLDGQLPAEGVTLVRSLPAVVARLAEERGHESLFFPEHTHIPASRQSPWPGGRELPRKYAHTFDLFV